LRVGGLFKGFKVESPEPRALRQRAYIQVVKQEDINIKRER
jgi:hypothetical protein